MLDALSKDENHVNQRTIKPSFQHLRTQKWYGWISLNQEGPRQVRLTGEVEGRNAGQRAILLKKRGTYAENILCLELVLNQDSGKWADVDCWISLQFQEYMLGTFYTMVHIYSDGHLMEKFPIDMLANSTTARPY